MTTFNEFFNDFRLTAQERAELIYFLAAYRARRTIEVLHTVDMSVIHDPSSFDPVVPEGLGAND